MNAYELADTLQETEPYYSTDYKLFDNAAAMLRQQADRIKELERKATAFEQSCRVATTQIEALQKELEVKELVIDRLVDSFDNARACLNVDVEELERLYR